MTGRWRCGLAAAGALALLWVGRPSAAYPLRAARGLILVLAPGASLGDWRSPDTPVLRRLTEAAPLAVMPTRAAGTDFLAAYRVLAAGTRSPAAEERSLGAALRSAGVRTVALGGAEARVVAGLPGSVDEEEEPWRVHRAEAPEGLATDPAALAQAARDALEAARPQPVFVACRFDDIARADDYAAFALPRATVEQRRDALRGLDQLVAALTAAGGARPGAAGVLLVTPQPSAEAAARGERLGPVLLWQGEGPSPGGRAMLLTSPSTRRTPGLVANTDVAATVTALLGVPPAQGAVGAGRPLETMAVPRGEAPAAYLARRVATWAAQVREQKLLVGVPWALAGALLMAAWLSSGRGERARRRGHVLAVWAVSVPAALLLAAPLSPKAVERFWVVYAVAGGLSLLPPLLALRFPARRLLMGVCVATALVLVADGFLGSPFLARSPLSYSVVEAARFYGIGNEAEGTLLGAALVTASALGPGAAPAGIVVAAVFGLPQIGADFSGLLTALAGFATLALALRGRHVTGKQIAALVALGMLLVVGLSLWDASRGMGVRTHIGQAVTAVRVRGGGALLEIAARKAAMDARLLVTSPWAALLFAEIGAGWWLLRQRAAPREETLLPRRDVAALRAVAASGAMTFLINDSGVVAAATCLLYGVSLLAVAAAPPKSR